MTGPAEREQEAPAPEISDERAKQIRAVMRAIHGLDMDGGAPGGPEWEYVARIVDRLPGFGYEVIDAVAHEAKVSAQTRRNRSALVSAATRALAVLDMFIEQHDDPGSEAFGARYEMSVALHPFGSQDHIRAAEDQVRRDERHKVAGEVRALFEDPWREKEFLNDHGLSMSCGPGSAALAIAAEIENQP